MVVPAPPRRSRGAAEWVQLEPSPATAGIRAPARRRVDREAILAFLAIAVVFAILGALLAGELWLSNRVVPGVFVWNIDLGGLTRGQAAERLAAEFRYPDDRLVTLTYGDRSWPVDPGQLGAQLDVDATIDAALQVGHTGDPMARLRDQAGAVLKGRLVVPALIFEPGASGAFLGRVAGEVNTPLRNAALSLGPDMSVQIVPAVVGREVDQESTREALVRRMGEMGGGEVPLVVRESQPVLTDVSAAQAQVQRIVSGPVTLTAPDAGPWTIEPKTLAGWIVLQPTAGGDGQMALAVDLDSAQMTQLAETIAGEVAREPKNARFSFDDAAGRLLVESESVPGRTLDVTSTVALIEQAATGDRRTVELPLRAVRPQVASDDPAALGITGLIGEGQTSFSGSSSARIQNISVGASQFDGLLIPPGETFSFNHYLGEVTKEKGYEEGIIIWGNTTKADVGGGLCQVSSTAFRAAFWAGLPIVERYPHAFRVGYYEPPLGLDATIYSPDVDLKWVNDTGHYILIQTYVDRENETVTFRYYGTNPGRTVEMEGPIESNPVAHGPAVYREDPTLPKGETKQIEFAKDGLDVTVYRIIKENGVEVQRDEFFSRYQPWQAVFLVGTKE
jgi:vancomycin resistance protein YoaR